MTPEYFILPIIINQLTKAWENMKTDIIIIDCMFIGFIILIFMNISSLKKHANKKLALYYKESYYSIILTTEGENMSTKFRAIMWTLANNKTIYRLKEVNEFVWSNGGDNKIEHSSDYIVDQSNDFILEDGIRGNIVKSDKKKLRGDQCEFIEQRTLTIYSNTVDLTCLQKWINNQVDKYKQFLRKKCANKQLLLTILPTNKSDDKNKIFKVESVEWDSNVSFNNSYLPDKNNILHKIDFFLNNKQWYIDRGIPYNLGILLYGDPGCGKTRFIKQLINYTKRHAIDIKLSDKINFNALKTILLNEEIDEDYIIPQDERIVIFEDIDAMGDIVKDRDFKKNKDSINQFDLSTINKEKTKDKDNLFELFESMSKLDNNNLSFLLNILDGLNECSGRIVIMTTNKIEQLDKALIRPGRIDIKINFKKCTTQDIVNMIELYWGQLIDIKSDYNNKYTSAEIISMFRSANNFEEICNIFLT